MNKYRSNDRLRKRFICSYSSRSPRWASTVMSQLERPIPLQTDFSLSAPTAIGPAQPNPDRFFILCQNAYDQMDSAHTATAQSSLDVGLSVTVALINRRIDLVLYRLCSLFCVIGCSHGPEAYEDGKNTVQKEIGLPLKKPLQNYKKS
ncbi:hypothetical protein J6590_024235 [Homalodisca vitripennis]|nr:hypothetical protein J6590_024235 [Homalodisca vitripennis]